MQKLVDAELFGAGLVQITSATLVERYNQCMIQLGLEPTALDSFSIDGLGWSPEVAEEKSNPRYLSAGDANPMAIILTVNQKAKPIYMPFCSFSRYMMEAFFDRFSNEIADITRNAGICLDLDQDITSYGHVEDLLMIEGVTIRPRSEELFELAREQRHLVQELTGDNMSWFNYGKRKALMDNASKIGDVRYRRIDLPDMVFDDFKSFYTQAFGGVFVLRKSRKKLLVVEDESLAGDKKSIMSVSDPNLVEYLKKNKFVDVDLEWYRNNPDTLEHLWECLVLEIVADFDDSLDLTEMNEIQLKGVLQKCKDDQRLAVVNALERLQLSLKKGLKPDRLDLDLETLLLHPKARLPKPERKLVWRLLVRLQQYNTLRMYISDKQYFLHHYMQWKEGKKSWVVDMLKARFRSRAMKKQTAKQQKGVA